MGGCVPLRGEVAVVPDPTSHRPVWVEESRNLLLPEEGLYPRLGLRPAARGQIRRRGTGRARGPDRRHHRVRQQVLLFVVYQRSLRSSMEDNVARNESLERGLLMLNEYPGLKASATVLKTSGGVRHPLCVACHYRHDKLASFSRPQFCNLLIYCNFIRCLLCDPFLGGSPYWVMLNFRLRATLFLNGSILYHRREERR